MPKEELIIVVQTNLFKNKIQEAELSIDDISEGLENLDNLQLCYYETEKDRKSNKNGRIAIPFNNGEFILLVLRDDEDEDHFIAVDFIDNRGKRVFMDDEDCIALAHTRCQLIEYSSDINRYKSDAVDHIEIENKVHNLQPWEPYMSKNLEAKKWQAYFELCKKILENNEATFHLANISFPGKHLAGDILESDIDTKQKISGKDLNFILDTSEDTHRNPTVGKIKTANSGKIRIDMDKDFLISYRSLISNSSDVLMLDNDTNATISILSVDDYHHKLNENSGIEKQVQIYLDTDSHSAFQANGFTDNSNTNCYIDQDSIFPTKLRCKVDYFSERYQLGVMSRCFEEVQQRPIWEVLSGERVSKLPNEVDVSFDNPKLNLEQRKAIKGALGSQELFMIWGPPGTGKTEVIKEIAKHEIARGNKTLIVSQSNLAVDNALARLYDCNDAYPLRIAKQDYELEGEDSMKVPLGNSAPKFYLEYVKHNLSDTMIEECKGIQQQYLKDVEKRISAKAKKKLSDAEKREIKQFGELYKKKINVVGATLMESGKTKRVNNSWVNNLCNVTGINEFETVIIDEVSKATPPELFIPIPLGKKVILVGDYKQLPPMFNLDSVDDTTLEDLASELNISQTDLDQEDTIFQRLWERHSGDSSPVKAMLRQQYRMHPKIQALIEQFYTDSESNDTLICGLNEEEIRSLNIDHSLLKDRPALWIGTKESSEDVKSRTSFYNEDEIHKVGLVLDKLLEHGDKELSIGVITFYGAQLSKLKKEYGSYVNKFGEGKLIFGTVDRFQGRECDVIICSLVRNNKSSNIGFAKKPNRINVAFSRAKKALIILGHRNTFPYGKRKVDATAMYKEVYDNCERPKPKELEA